MLQLETLSIDVLNSIHGGTEQPLTSSTEMSAKVDPVTKTVEGTAKTTSSTTERNQCYSDRFYERTTWSERNLFGVDKEKRAEITKAQLDLCK